MKIFRILNLLAITLVLVVACKPATPNASPDPVPVAAPAATSPANPVDAVSVVDNTPATTATGLDSKAMAGRFSDGESVLELRADGSYLQTLNAAGGSISSDGTWSGTDSKRLLLDPNSKSANDVVFDVSSNEVLRSEDGTHTFRRIAGK